MENSIGLDDLYRVENERSYSELLSIVQAQMGKNFIDFDEDKPEATFLFKKSIESFLASEGLSCSGVTRRSALVDCLYNSMAKYDILTDLLNPDVYMEQGIEEIYGRWDSIYILCKKGKVLLPDKFPSPEAATNILNRMVQKFNRQLNEGTPLALGEFCPNIRISCVGVPITSRDVSTEFNIRIVHGSKMTREMLLNSHTISEDGLDFLELCVKHKIGVCISGGTGSGKTGTMTYLLSTVTQDRSYRIGTIEIECREFDLIRYNDKGECLNDVFSFVTRNSDDPTQNVSANALLKTVLRLKPDIIGMGEMRDEESRIVCEAATTGHGVISTTHCDSAADTPKRIVELCKKAGGNDDHRTLMQMAAKAFPIVVHQRLEMDGHTRRVYEISECTGCDEYGEPTMYTLFEFEVTDNLVEERRTVGQFRASGKISKNLRQRLLRNGAALSEISRF